MDQSPSPSEAALRLANWVGGLVAIRAACYGLRLGLLEALHGVHRGLTAAELARRLELDPAYVAAWCASAVRAGLIESDAESGRYRLRQALGDVLLDPDNPAYMGGLLLTHELEIRIADRLVGCVASGGGLARDDYGPGLATALAAIARPAYHVLRERVLPALPNLPPALQEERKVLEVGCGAGTGLLALAQAFPHATVTGVDPDGAAVAAADAAIRNAGLQERTSVAQMRGEDLSAADQYDLIYIHDGLDEMDDAGAVAANAYRALRPGGMLLITRVRSGESADRAGNPLEAFVTYLDAYVHMPRRVAAGRGTATPLSRAEIEQLIVAAGFPVLEELPLDLPLLDILYARKPA